MSRNDGRSLFRTSPNITLLFKRNNLQLEILGTLIFLKLWHLVKSKLVRKTEASELSPFAPLFITVNGASMLKL